MRREERDVYYDAVTYQRDHLGGTSNVKLKEQ